MAKILGESGRYVSDQVMAKEESIRLVALVCIGMAGILVGMMLGRTFLSASVPSSIFIPVAFILLALLFLRFKWSIREMDKLAKERIAMQRGVAGEVGVGLILQKFPDSFYVINDLTTPFGNLDHVVVGPTGVFALDSKNWRGVVSADGKGELLLNGKPTDKPLVRQFVGRMMGIRDKVMLIAPGQDVFCDALFVFTAARVDAIWGKTGSVKCIRDEQLYDYIVEKDFGQKLNSQEAQRIAQAFLAVARMDKDFGQAPPTLNANEPPKTKARQIAKAMSE